MSVERESDVLHERVQSLIFAPEQASSKFEPLALDIARFQARHCPGFARLQASRGAALERLQDIVPVPVDAFRHARVAVHGAELDAARFATSGTSGAQTGWHVMRRTDTYRLGCLSLGRAALLRRGSIHAVVSCLFKEPSNPGTSSLGFMMGAFAEVFDPLGTHPEYRPWRITEAGIDLDGMERDRERSRAQGLVWLVLATSYALVQLCDQLSERRLDANSGVVVMETGGLKGRVRPVDPARQRERLLSVFGEGTTEIVGEYGMTELTSQLYEGTLRGGALSGPPGVYLPAPWLRVDAVDPHTLCPLPEGGVGLARFVDLANIDSAVSILTQDLVRQRSPGVELLGRAPGAPARGCSLASAAWSKSSTEPA